jgi:hypothetical protein
VADYEDDDNKKAGDFDMECVMTVARSGKRQERPLTEHFERLLEGACSNHAYPIKHKLKGCSMMKNFMTSFTRDREPEEDPDESDAMPFPREDVIMMVYNGHPIQGGTTCLT